MDEEIPSSSSKSGLGGFSALGRNPDGLDELQRWKLEKRAKEEAKEREEREAAFAMESKPPTLNHAVPGVAGIVVHSSIAPPSNTLDAADKKERATEESSTPSMSGEKEEAKEVDEHKTPKPSKVQVPEWATGQPPLPSLTQNSNAGIIGSSTSSSSATPLDALKAFMGVQDSPSALSPASAVGNAPPASATNGAFGAGGNVNGVFSSSTASSPLSSNYSPSVARPAGSGSAINYDAVGKATCTFWLGLVMFTSLLSLCSRF